MIPSWVWVAFAAMDYGVLHSLLAADCVKSAAESRYPSIFPRYYRLMYNILAGLFLVPIGLLVLFLPDKSVYSIPFPYILATLAGQGLCLLAAGMALKGTGVDDLLGLSTAAGAAQASGGLKTDGAYRLVRHPVYTLGFITMLLFPWMTANRLALFVTLTLYMVIGAHLEEQRLLRIYGADYARYRQQVPMFFPRLFPRPDPD